MVVDIFCLNSVLEKSGGRIMPSLNSACVLVYKPGKMGGNQNVYQPENLEIAV